MNFNKQQLEAISHKDGACVLLAAAGSGKSTTLLERINRLCQSGVEQSKILAISFTNATATELKEKLNNKGLQNVAVGTFHSICRNILLSEGYENIMSFPNKYKVKREMENVLGERNINIEDIMSFISYQKAHFLTPFDEFKNKESMYSISELTQCYITYEDFKTRTNTYDFDDWLWMTVDVCRKNPNKYVWDYVNCDEKQDNNSIHDILIRLWCPKNNIMVVGDLNQSIYGFNAAVPELFANFHKTIPNTKVINMNTNYRSCKKIVEKANDFIRPYNHGFELYKDAVAFNQEEGMVYGKVFEDRRSEAVIVARQIEKLIADGVNVNDIAVLYRNNAHADYIENELKQRNICYRIFSNGSFFERKEIKGILSILRLVENTTDDEAFENIFCDLRCYPVNYYRSELINQLISESGAKNCSLYEAFLDHKFEQKWQKNNAEMFVDFISRLKIQNEKHLSPAKMIDNILKMFKIIDGIKEKYEISSWQDKIDSIENLKTISDGYSLNGFLKYISTGTIGKKQDNDGVSLMTCHKSKGLEYDYTFVIGLEDDKFPSNRSSEIEEARLFYVAVTRAKKWLQISSIGRSLFYDSYFSN